MYRTLYEAPVVMVRIFMAYGPGQPDWKLIPATALRMLRGEQAVIDSPERQVDWIYISDVVEGLLAVLAAPGMPEDVVELGSGKLTAIRDIVDRLRRLTGCALPPAYGSGRARGNDLVRKADLARTAASIGWAPRIPLEEGLTATVAALRQQVRSVRTGQP
jgi:nucleoside-diphosphate-sugar epimerase